MSNTNKEITTLDDSPTSFDTTKTDTTKGRTNFDDIVVAKIAGIATREVSGVYDLGGSFDRLAGTVRDFIPGNNTNVAQGIDVEVGEKQAAIDVTLIAEYGVAIHELAYAVRQNIISSVERMTGLEVTEVNVDIIDVHTKYHSRQNNNTATGNNPALESHEKPEPRVR